MTINLLARPRVPEWEPTPEWTSLTLEGDDESAIANVIVSQLLLTRHEVSVEEEAEELTWEDDDGQTS
jgi:hypothetical protein